MKQIAYLVLAHADPKHFERLINAIDYKAKFFVHIDAKSNLDDFKNLTLPKDVFFLEDRVSVSWAGISMVDATLKLIESTLKSGEDFSHLVLISGSDYPIKKSSFIYETFVKNPEHEFIKYIDMRQSSHYILHVKQKWFKTPLFQTTNKTLKLADKIVREIGNKLRLANHWDKSIIPYFGSQWWAITPGSAKYVLDFVRDNPNFYTANTYTFSPDEHFFHTIIGNSPYRQKSDGVQEFKQRGTWRLANFHIIHTLLSKWYTTDDWEQIITSDKLFVRKLNSLKSDGLISLINEKILDTGNNKINI